MSSKLVGLTLDQINYRLQMGMLSLEDAEEVVKWWNENRVSTTAYVALIPTSVLEIPQILTEVRP